jgi:hypothetical protein
MGKRPEELVSTIVKEGYAYWTRIRGARRMPSRADLNPVDIPRLLPYVMLIDVLSDPLDFRFRLLGTEHDAIVGGNYRGRLFSTLPHLAEGNPIWARYAKVVAERRPVCGYVSYVGADRYVRHELEECLMPLSADGETVDMIFVVTAVEREPSAGTPFARRIAG